MLQLSVLGVAPPRGGHALTEGRGTCPVAEGWHRGREAARVRGINNFTNWMWDLPTSGNSEFRLSRQTNSTCALTMRLSNGTLVASSGFLFGECLSPLQATIPRVIDWKSGVREFTDPWPSQRFIHGKRWLTKGVNPACTADKGGNPSIVALPAYHTLRVQVPGARYLIAMNGYPLFVKSVPRGMFSIKEDASAQTADLEVTKDGWCPIEPPTTVGLYDRDFKPLLVTALRREHDNRTVNDIIEGDDVAYFSQFGSGSGSGVPPGPPPLVEWSSMADIGLAEVDGHFFASGQDYYSTGGTDNSFDKNTLSLSAVFFPLRVTH